MDKINFIHSREFLEWSKYKLQGLFCYCAGHVYVFTLGLETIRKLNHTCCPNILCGVSYVYICGPEWSHILYQMIWFKLQPNLLVKKKSKKAYGINNQSTFASCETHVPNLSHFCFRIFSNYNSICRAMKSQSFFMMYDIMRIGMVNI